MSYNIVKEIKIEGDKVMVTSASNNVRPHYYEKWECYLISEVLQKSGLEAAEVEILENYENGNFQGGSNKYTRALTVLRHFPEYEKFDWRNSNETTDENRKSPEFEELLKKALVTYLPKDKYILTKPQEEGKKIYLRKARRYATWTSDKTKAKIFRFKEQADNIKKWFHGSGSWEVEKIA